MSVIDETVFGKQSQATASRLSDHASRLRHLVFVDPASRAMLSMLDRVAPSDAAVQISGETGTGKEWVARYIHWKSNRSGPFSAINCGAIAEHLAESELFGHEAGSFTGASARREGWFEATNGGTLFLDEVGDLPLALQVKLLRVLQEGEVTRVGSRRSIRVNVRIVTASNADLTDAVAKGKFRQDLLYRLNIVPVHLLPLRERRHDIEALSRHFLEVYSERLGREPATLAQGAIDVLRAYSWPGNIRELENVIHRTLLISGADHLEAAHIQISELKGMRQSASPGDASALRHALRNLFDAPGSNLMRDVERQLVEDSFRYCDSNQVRTAELLGVSRNVVRTLLKRYGLLNEAEADIYEIPLNAAHPYPRLVS
jgi:DNA-binding NtrC family response regulator